MIDPCDKEPVEEWCNDSAGGGSAVTPAKRTKRVVTSENNDKVC
jgi:hypothetical protein